MTSSPNTSFFSPLRYPGGKARLGPWLRDVLEHNNIQKATYVEAYAGGVGAGLFLLFQGHIQRLVINDADPVIYAFWVACVQHTDDLIALIRKTRVNMSTRRKSQRVLLNLEHHSVVEIAFAVLFLNRTSRSGILSAGVIGGKKQQGAYKMNARYNKKNLIERIARIGEQRRHIRVMNMDALDLIHQYIPRLSRERTLIYLDPPYYHKGQQLYRNFYQHQDHVLISKAFKKMKHHVVLTYDDTPDIRRMYRGVNTRTFSFAYSVHHKTSPQKQSLVDQANSHPAKKSLQTPSHNPITSPSPNPLTNQGHEILFSRHLRLPFDPYMTRSI